MSFSFFYLNEGPYLHYIFPFPNSKEVSKMSVHLMVPADKMEKVLPPSMAREMLWTDHSDSWVLHLQIAMSTLITVSRNVVWGLRMPRISFATSLTINLSKGG